MVVTYGYQEIWKYSVRYQKSAGFCIYLEVNTDGGNHVTDQEEGCSDQGSLAGTNTLQPGTVDGSRETKETDGDVEGDGRVVLVGDLLALSVDGESVELLVNGVVEDGPGIEGT